MATSSYGSYWYMVPADVNGDGRTDMLAYFIGANAGIYLRAFLSQGDGTFQAQAQQTMATSMYDNQWCMVPADLNGDGRTDMLAYSIGGNWPMGGQGIALSAFLSRGNGEFEPTGLQVAATTGYIGDYWHMVPADVNGDGRTDMLAYYIGANAGIYLRAFLSQGDGTLQAQAQQTMATSSYGSYWYWSPRTWTAMVHATLSRTS